MKKTTRVLSAAVAATSLITTIGLNHASGAASTYTWSPVGGSNNFYVAANWTPTGGPPNHTNGDIADFDGSSAAATGSLTTASVGMNTVGGPDPLYFGDYGAPAAAATINTPAYTIASSSVVQSTNNGWAITVFSGVAANQTVAYNIAAPDHSAATGSNILANTLDNENSGSLASEQLIFNGNFYTTVSSSNPTTVWTLTFDGLGTKVYNGTISDNNTGYGAVAVAVSTSNYLISNGSYTSHANDNGFTTLNGTNTYSGGTTLTAGVLTLGNATGSATGAGTVTVTPASGAPTNILSGTGTSYGALTVTGGARIGPGNNTTGTNKDFGAAGVLSLGTGGTIGSTTVTGGMTLNNANLDFDLSSSTLSGNDEILTGGTFALTTVNFSFNELNGSLQTGTAYPLISGYTAPLGSLSGIAGSVIQGGYTVAFSQSAPGGVNELDATFTATPEPASLGLFGVAGLMLGRRRRHSARA